MAKREQPRSWAALLCIAIALSPIVADGFVPSTHQGVAITSAPNHPSPTSLSAKGGGKKKKSKRSAQTAKGFGAPPPKLEDVLSSFKTRMPDDADAQACPCGSAKVYGECCGPLHRGERICTTMTDVLRSRYSAFSWRNVQYVMDTTHEACRDWRADRLAWARDLDKGGMFDSFEFVNLEAGQEEPGENENEGYVTFKVTLRAKEDRGSAVAGQETVISERSKFLWDPEDGSWSYASGDVRSDVAGLEETTLNA